MDRDDWINSLRHSCEELFISEENILTIFTSTGHRFESILSRDVNSVTNIPDIYDATRDLFFIFKKFFEILPGSTALNEYEIEGESLRFSSYRLGFQRRLNILTPIEYHSSYILKFIGSTINFFPNHILGAIGDKETAVIHWNSDTDDIPSFFYRAAIADGNSLLERSQIDMNIGAIHEVTVFTDKHSFLLTVNDATDDIMIVEQNESNAEWLNRLIFLFNRFSKDKQYSLPETNPLNKEIIIHMSLVILRRFLSYLLPPRKKGSIPFVKIAQTTNIPEDLLISYFDSTLDPEILNNFGLILKKEESSVKGTQIVNYTLVIDKLSNTRVLSYYLMEINRFFDQYVNILPSKSKSASASGFIQYQSTSNYLGQIWGSYVFGSVLGESDTLFNLNNEIITEIKELIESRNLLFEIKAEIEKYSSESEKADQLIIDSATTQYQKLTSILNEKILQLNEKIARFTASIIQSYFIMLKTITIPTRVSTTKKSQQLHSVIEFTFEVNSKIVALHDDPKDWITLVFFSHILSQGNVTVFKDSLGKELSEYYESIFKVWDGIQLLTFESEEWTITNQLQQLYIKPTRRRDMLLKFLNLKSQ